MTDSLGGRFSALNPSLKVTPRLSRKVDIGGYTFSSEPLTTCPRSRKAAATDPMAVPQMPMKWKLRVALLTSRSLRAEPPFRYEQNQMRSKRPPAAHEMHLAERIKKD